MPWKDKDGSLGGQLGRDAQRDRKLKITVMKKKKCDTCGKTFSRPTEVEAAQALRGHLISAHKENIKPDSELTERQRKKREYNRWYNAQRRKTKDEGDAPLIGRPPKKTQQTLTSEQQERRKAYSAEWRRRRKMAKSRNGAMTGAARFCPHCGMNLEVLATAMAVVNKV